MARHIPLALAWLVAIFLVAPMAIIVPMSFSTAISFEFPPPSYWTGYYSQYFGSHAWLEATANSFVIAFGSMVFTLLVALPAAFGFVRYRFHGKSMFNLLLMLPIIVPAVVSALGYYSFLALAYLVGTYTGMIIAHSVLSIPIAFLVISAALKGFDRNLERAAMSAGAGPLRTFFWVTLPVLRPGILVGALFAFLHSFNEAVVAIFIAGRDASTLPKKMFESIRIESDPVIAVVSTLLTGAVFLGVLFMIDPTIAPDFTAGLANSMYHESELFVRDVLWNRNLSEFLTSRRAVINQSLATLYGVAFPPAGVPLRSTASSRALSAGRTAFSRAPSRSVVCRSSSAWASAATGSSTVPSTPGRASTTSTSTPAQTSASAVSRPMYPAPTTTARRTAPLASSRRSRIASSRDRIVNTRGSSRPGTGGHTGSAPVVTTSVS